MRTHSSAATRAWRREAVALRAEHQGHLVELVRGGVVDVGGLLVGGQGQQPVARPADRFQALGPRFQAGVRDREDRAHRHLHRAPVQRVGAVRREQDRVHAEGGGAAEDRADVGVVVDRLHDHHPAGGGEEFVGGRQRLALHRGERPPVHVVAGDAFGEVRADRVHGRRELVDDVPHDVDPLGREQHRAHLVAGVLGPSDDLLALGDEEAFGGFAAAPQLHVGQARVVAQAGVVGVLDGDEIGHRVILPCPG